MKITIEIKDGNSAELNVGGRKIVVAVSGEEHVVHGLRCDEAYHSLGGLVTARIAETARDLARIYGGVTAQLPGQKTWDKFADWKDLDLDPDLFADLYGPEWAEGVRKV